MFEQAGLWHLCQAFMSHDIMSHDRVTPWDDGTSWVSTGVAQLNDITPGVENLTQCIQLLNQ